MRYDRQIYFVKEGQRIYDEATADYKDGEPTLTVVYASVNPVSALAGTLNHKLVIALGQIKEDSFIVRLQNHYDKPYDYILIDEKRFNVDYSRKLRARHTLIVSEVQ